MQVLVQTYAESAPGSRSWEPVARGRRLRRVVRCPKWFADGEVEQDSDGRALRRRESGVVVTLEVPGTDSWLSHAVREARGIPQRGAEPGAETAGITAAALTDLLETLSTVAAPPGSHGRSGTTGPRRHA
nr:DUF6578 domain-containing protein [Streptomyces afghaniensis]